jgi:mRNA interferase MazF
LHVLRLRGVIFAKNKRANPNGPEEFMVTSVKRGDIYYADLSPVVGSEQGGVRPVLVIQNDVGNKYSPTVIVAAITSGMSKTKLPTHIDVYADKAGVARDSVVLLEQLRTLDKRRLKEKMGHLEDAVMREIDNAIAVSLGLLPHGARLPEGTPPRTVPAYTVAAAVAEQGMPPEVIG